MSIEEVFAAVVLALAGGSGVVGLAMTYLRRYIDRKLEAGKRRLPAACSTAGVWQWEYVQDQ